ncbi:MAG: GNAT family N-acetyltransferase [Gemmatimonadaceae bacterium]
MQSASFIIHALGAADADEYQALRLRGMRESAESFGSTFDEDAALPLTTVAERLSSSSENGERIVLGAFIANVDEVPVMIGIVGCMRESKIKLRHKAVLWGLYVAPESRGHGVGQMLIQHLLTAARTWRGLQRIVLSVVVRSTAARKLYLSVGFVSFGIEHDALRQNSISDDVEMMSLDISASRQQ